MKEIVIGEYIKQRRLALGLLQKEVCDGICEPATMSRLENGKQTPSRKVINAILERLDLPGDRYFGLIWEHEAEMENLEEDIVSLNIAFERSVGQEKQRIMEQALGKISELEKMTKDEDVSTRQFLLRSKVLLGKEILSMEEQLSMLLEAIRMTVPQFELTRIRQFLYCLEEILTINQIAGVYTLHGRHQEAAEIYGQLLEYARNHYQNILRTRGHLPMVALNYARVLNLCGRNEEALEAAELGRQACIKYKNYQMLPRLVHTMANIYHDLGNHTESQRLYQKGRNLCQLIEDWEDLDSISKDAAEQYGMIFKD